MRESRDNAKRLQRIKKNRQKDYGSKSESFLFVFPKIRIRYLEGSISNKTTKVQNSIKTVILGDWGISQSVLRYETFKSNNSYDVINNSYDISYTFGNKLNFTLGLGFIYDGMAYIRTSKNLYTSSKVSGNSFFGVLGFELGMIEYLIGNRINNIIILLSFSIFAGCDGEYTGNEDEVSKNISDIDSMILVAGNMGVLKSSNGVDWDTTNLIDAVNDVAYGDGIFVSTGHGGIIYTSTDGNTWVTRSSGANGQLKGVVYGGGNFVVVGTYGSITTSSNGSSWTLRKSDDGELNSVSYGIGKYVVVGSTNQIYVSNDSINWKSVNSNTNRHLKDVTFGNDIFVAVGNGGTIVTSGDGETWSLQTNGTCCEHLAGVTYGKNIFLSVGDSGTILKSNNTIHWESINSEYSTDLNKIIYVNNKFIVVGHQGTILTSKDGISWNSINIGTSSELKNITSD